MIRSGDYSLSLTNDGYHEMTTGLNVTEDQSQTHSYQMDRLPGVISIITEGLAGARAKIDGVDVGTTPIFEIPVEYGNHRLEVTYERYLDFEMAIDVEGRGVEQDFTARLEPAWALVSLATVPEGAEVMLDLSLIHI